jgi:hypothetical protein
MLSHLKPALIAGAALITLGIAGCGAASATPAVRATATPAPTATPTPAPTADPIVAAGQAYLSAITIYNVSVDKVNICEKPSQLTYKQAVPCEKEWLAAQEAFQKAIYAYSWPISVQSQITALAAAAQADIETTNNFIAEPDAATWNAATDTASAASAAVRLALHLPPVPSS